MGSPPEARSGIERSGSRRWKPAPPRAQAVSAPEGSRGDAGAAYARKRPQPMTVTPSSESGPRGAVLPRASPPPRVTDRRAGRRSGRGPSNHSRACLRRRAGACDGGGAPPPGTRSRRPAGPTGGKRRRADRGHGGRRRQGSGHGPWPPAAFRTRRALALIEPPRPRARRALARTPADGCRAGCRCHRPRRRSGRRRSRPPSRPLGRPAAIGPRSRRHRAPVPPSPSSGPAVTGPRPLRARGASAPPPVAGGARRHRGRPGSACAGRPWR